MALQMPDEISFVRVVLRAQVALKARSGLTTPLDVIQIRGLMNELLPAHRTLEILSLCHWNV